MEQWRTALADLALSCPSSSRVSIPPLPLSSLTQPHPASVGPKSSPQGTYQHREISLPAFRKVKFLLFHSTTLRLHKL